jgi:predicted dehydrogenase
MDVKPLRVGIVGTGGIAVNHHVPNFLRCPNVEVVAACDISEAALEQMRARHGVTDCYRDYCELLARDDLGIISVCTSNDMHYPVVMAAAERGLDIFCEKPLAMDLCQAREMWAAAEAKGLKTGVNFSHRRTPAAQLAREIIARGALGTITTVQAVYAAGGVGYAQHPGTWRNDRQRAGWGGLGDMGAHMLDMLGWWLDDDVAEVAAYTRTFVPQRLSRETGLPMTVTTEDQGMVLMAFASGAMGYLCGGYIFTGRGYDQRIEVYGSEGGLMYNQQRPLELDVYLPPEILADYQVLRQGKTPDTPYTTILVPERLQGLIPGQNGVRRSVIMDYVDAYRASHGRDGAFCFEPGFAEGVRVQAILDACALAERDARWVQLPL